jgi:hypothetical protein
VFARRIIAVSSDKAFGKRLAIALQAAGGAVDCYASPGELGEDTLQAALVVLHLDGELAGAALPLIERLTGDTPVIAILPRSDLAALVDVMQASERIAGILVADAFDPHALSAMATRVLAGDIFGLEKVTRWGTQIHTFLVSDYQEKSLCIARLSQFAEEMGLRRKYREAIEQALDEMLMNALYDAPVDEHGQPIFAEIPTKTRISLRIEQKVVVQYACDGKQFAFGVRDAFGTLERATVLRYLHKCLHSEQQIDRKTGGAGLGLYLIASSASEVYFNVLPGVATEAICTLDLEVPKLQLARFGFFFERIDAAGRLASGPSRRLPAVKSPSATLPAVAPPPPAAPRGLLSLLVAAVLITVGLVVLLAWPRVFTKKAAVTFQTTPVGAAIDIDGKPAGTTAGGPLVVKDLEVGRAYPVVARLEGFEPRQVVVQPRGGKDNAIAIDLVALAATVVLDSAPTGASVELDGRPAGATPLTLTTLRPGAAVALVFRKPGYQDAPARLDVPRPGKEVRLIQPLAVSQELARVRLVSEPPGARILQNGQLIPAVTTPTEVLVEANKPVRFMLTMPRRVPLVIDTFTPTPGAGDIVRGGKLAEGATLRVAASAEGKLDVRRAPHCQDLALPAECTLAPGTYAVQVTLPEGPPITRTVRIGTKDVELDLELGFVDAGPRRTIVLPGGGVRRAAFEPGPRRITVSDGETSRQVVVTVRANATVPAPP